MNRLSTALCLSVSCVALGLAAVALLERRSGGPAASSEAEVADLSELQSELDSLRERVDAFEERQAALARRTSEAYAKGRIAPRRAVGEAGEPVSTEGAELEEQVAVLNARLASLEDSETIARLARSGRERVAEKELLAALDSVGDPDVVPEDRLKAWQTVRRFGKSQRDRIGAEFEERGLQERDFVLPLLDLAQDATLDPEFRVEVMRSLHGSRVEEIRQPMLDVLASNESSEVRAEAMTALYWHIDDASVRQAITAVSQNESDEIMHARAQRIMPKVEHIEREAARSAESADSGEK